MFLPKEICPCQMGQGLGATVSCLKHQVLETMSQLDRLFVHELTPEAHVLLGQTKNQLSHGTHKTAHPELVPAWNHIPLSQALPLHLPQVLQLCPKVYQQ